MECSEGVYEGCLGFFGGGLQVDHFCYEVVQCHVYIAVVVQYRGEAEQHNVMPLRRPGWRSAEIYARSVKTRERRSAVAGVREWTLEWGKGQS
jgi:hypothetical protein